MRWQKRALRKGLHNRMAEIRKRKGEVTGEGRIQWLKGRREG